MSGEVFGLHGVIEGERDLDDLMRRFDALAATLGLEAVAPRQALSYTTRAVTRGYARAGASTLDLQLGIDAGQTHLLVHEWIERIGRYDLPLFVEWFTGLCDIANPLFARAFCSQSFDPILIGEAETQPGHLTWWQYLGPAMTTRMGRIGLLFGPYVRVEPRATGGCIVWTALQPPDVEIWPPAPTAA
jgi:hypothetical protein